MADFVAGNSFPEQPFGFVLAEKMNKSKVSGVHCIKIDFAVES
jgi:hypothetical protein